MFQEEEQVAGTKKGKKHIVVFQDEEGNVLKTSFVSDEEAALPPDMPEKKGESAHHEIKFQGWDKDISCVRENLVVKAVYKEVPKEYLVMYFHENGKMLGTETVPYGQAATQPYHPQKPQTERYDYIFKGWNNDLSHIEKDTMAKAVFEERERSFVVRFFHEDGTLLKEEQVLYGQAAILPEDPEKQPDEVWHYIFDGWDRAFDNITEDTEVYAVFSPVYNEYRIRIYEQIRPEAVGSKKQGQELSKEKMTEVSQEQLQEEVTQEQSREELTQVTQEQSQEELTEQSPEQSPESLRKLSDRQESEKLIEERTYHYGDKISYPDLKKKGYTLQWDIHPETVTKDTEIHASWTFSNPVGRIFEIDGNRYQILNPSIKNGSVCLLYYIDDASQVHVPEQVKIGGYYYFIEKIGPQAFSDCIKMRRITLPDCIRVLEQEALVYCKRLEEVIVGSGRNSRLHSIKRNAFGENEHLKAVYLNGRNLRKVHVDTFDRLKRPLAVYVRPEELGRINKLFQRGLNTGKVQIKTSK